MRRLTLIVALLVLILGAFSLVGCTDEPEIIDEVQYIYDEFDHPDDSLYEFVEDGSPYISQEIVRVSTEEIVIRYTNISDDVWVSDEGHALQYLNRSHLARDRSAPGQSDQDFDPDDVWFDMDPLVAELTIKSFVLESGESLDVTINLIEFCTDIEPGIYRIVKEFTPEGSGNFEPIRVITQFDIE